MTLTQRHTHHMPVVTHHGPDRARVHSDTGTGERLPCPLELTDVVGNVLEVVRMRAEKGLATPGDLGSPPQSGDMGGRGALLQDKKKTLWLFSPAKGVTQTGASTGAPVFGHPGSYSEDESGDGV